MEKKFTSDELPLAHVLDLAAKGKIQLPDFQRGWVWDDEHITSLLASVSVSYPIGAVMTLETGNPDVRFRSQPLAGVQLPSPDTPPELLLLDGQQRLTSLYLALKSAGPVETTDARKRTIHRVYYADLMACIDPHADREEAIVSIPGDRLVKNFRGEVQLDLRSREKEIEAQMFPLSIVLDPSETTDWQLAYLSRGPGESDERLARWKEFNTRLVAPMTQYHVPTIQLVKSTPKDAVCQVFEKVNTGGVSLTVFELLTATYAADDFLLRDDWAAREERLRKLPVLGGVDAPSFLQVVTLLATYHRRAERLKESPDDERAPAVSCKRKEILRLPLADYRRWAEPATKAIERVAPFLHSERIYKRRDVPYATQVLPLAAAMALLGDAADSHAAREKLRQWYWCGVLGEMYGGTTETRFAMDVQDLKDWIGNDGPEPRTIRQAQFQAERLLTLRSRNSAAYKGLHALQMKRGARDFRTGQAMDVATYFEQAVDIHHVFPRDWCRKNDIADRIANCVINKTAIDAKTNGRIGSKAPSAYLELIETREGLSTADLDAILHSHDIDPVALRQDDFASYFNKRFERLIRQVEEAMGKPVNRTADAGESPFADSARDEGRLRAAVEELRKAGESQVVEFKATGRKNLHTGDKDPAIEWSVVKTVAAFMNGSGGTLLVGVADDGSVVGIEQDFPLVHKGDADGWELWLTTLLSTTLGKVAASDVAISLCRLEEGTVARVDVGPASKPVFAKAAKGDSQEKFLVRINNSTQELTGHDLLDFQKKRWPA